jgi:hypothetical protein
VKILFIVTIAILTACTSTPSYTPPPQLEREFGGIEIGKDFTPLNKDVDNALKIELNGHKPNQ